MSERASENALDRTPSGPEDSPPLVDDDFDRLARWAADHIGARIPPDQRERLRQRLEPMRAELAGTRSWNDLYRKLRIGSERDAYAADAVRRLTNKESYFFREAAHLALLAEEVIPARLRALRAEGRKELRILSAGCGRGQEPYSIAMAAAESGKVPPGYRVRILAVDVDDDALRSARSATYTEHSLRGVEEEARRKFFRLDESGRFEVRPAFRSNVSFERANIADGRWADEHPTQDVAFCRNVLIYLNDEAQAAAIRSLHRILAPGGFLFIGHVENVRAAPALFHVQRRPHATYLQKPGG